jgi:hypothetical protein
MADFGLGAKVGTSSKAFEDFKNARDTKKPGGVNPRQVLDQVERQLAPTVYNVQTAVNNVTDLLPSTVKQDWMREQQWETPDAPENPRGDKKYRKQRELEDFTYELEPWQIQQLTDLYANKPGYRAPELQGEPEPVKADDLTTTQLTWKKYDKLTPDQKAAVDFNTRLVEARELDLQLGQSGKSLTPEKLAQYRDDVTKMFGSEGGSDTVAIHTMELLKSIDFKAVGQDLDEYLSLERSVDLDELKTFKLTDTPVVEGVEKTFNSERERQQDAIRNPNQGPYTNLDALASPGNLDAVDSAAIRASKAQIEASMQDYSTNYWSWDTAMHPKEYTRADKDEVPIGYGDALRNPKLPAEDKKGRPNWSLDRFAAQSWEWLKDGQDFTMDDVEEFFVAYDYSPKERADWFGYINNRARNEMQYGAQKRIGVDGIEIPSRSPEEILSFVGLTKTEKEQVETVGDRLQAATGMM